MNMAEVQIEIMKDYKIIDNSSTLERLSFEYYKKRLKGKIKPEADFPVYFSIKSKAKNPWLILIRKNPEKKQVLSPYEGLAFYLLTYYYSDKGLRVFLATRDGIIKVYNGHFFTRYKERMKLDVIQPLDVVKTFFIRNDDPMVKFYPPDADNKIYFMGLLKEGYAMGEMQVSMTVIHWLVHKTFIANDTASGKHLDSEIQLKYLLAKKLLAIEKDPSLPVTKELSALAHQCGLMVNKQVVCDLNEIINTTPDHLKENLNDNLVSF
jgi:hypothetical protein